MPERQASACACGAPPVVARLQPLGEGDEPLGGVGAAVQEDVLDQPEELLRDLLVDRELARVDDPHVHAGGDGVVEEGRVHRLADGVVPAEGERDVRDAARDLRVRQLGLDAPRRLEEGEGVVGVLLDAGPDGQDVRVEEDVLRREALLLDEDPVRAAADLDLPVGRRRLPLLVERHDDRGGAVPPHRPGPLAERRLAVLQADRVDDGLPLQARQPRLDDLPAGAVDHDRDPRDVGVGREEVQEAAHRGDRVEHPLVHADVEDVRAPLHLLARDAERRLVVARGDELREPRRAGDVRPLADDDEVGVGADRERLEAGEAREPLDRRDGARRESLHGLGDRPDVRGVRAAAAADDVHPARLGEGAQVLRHRLRRLVEAAEGVREARVRVGRDEDGRDPGELLDVGAHLLRAEGAVDPDREERGVGDGVPERLDHLAREGPAAPVGDRHREHERHGRPALGEDLLDGDEGGLADERVEDRLDEEEVDAAVEEAADLLGVGRDEVGEDVRPLPRVVHVDGEGEGPVRRADRPGDPGRPPGVRRLEGADRLARDARRRGVHLADVRLEAVVGHRDRLRAEGAGLEDVGARVEVGAVDLGDDVGTREREDVGAPLQLARVVREARAAVGGLVQPVGLDHRPHPAVQDDDPLGERRREGDRERRGPPHRPPPAPAATGAGLLARRQRRQDPLHDVVPGHRHQVDAAGALGDRPRELDADGEPFLRLELRPLLGGPAHPGEDRLGDDHAGDLVREVERLLEALRRDEADEDRDEPGLGAGEEAVEGGDVVDGLRLGEGRPRLDLGRELGDLDVEVGRGRVGGAGDGERRGGPDRGAHQVDAGVQPPHDPEEAEGVDLADVPPLRVVADLQRVAADDEERLDAEAGRPEEVRLDAEDVPVARGEVEDGVDPRLVPDHVRHGDGRHPEARHRVVGDVDGVDAVAPEELGAVERGGGVGPLRRLDLHGDDERLRVGELSLQRRGLERLGRRGRRGGDERAGDALDGRAPLPDDLPRHGGDVGGRRAAAAADDRGAGLHEVARDLAEVVGRGGVDRPPRDVPGVAGVRHRGDGDADPRDDLLEDLERLLRADRAVHADDVRPRLLERRQRLDDLGPERRLAVGEERHRGEDRDLLREVARGLDRLDRLEPRGEGLEEEEVDLLLEEDPDLLGEELADHRLRERPVGLDELAERPDVARDEDVLAGGGLVGEPDGGAVDLLEGVGPVELGELDPVRVPGVRRQDLRARLDVVVVDLPDELGLGDRQGGARALGGRTARDEERPHRPVGEENVGLQALADVVLHEKTPPRTKGRFVRFASVRPRFHLSPAVPERELAPATPPCRTPRAPGGEEPVAAASQGPSLRRS